MQKINRFFEIAYLIIAIVFSINAITTIITNKTKALLYGAFAIMAIFMFFFKRKYRKKWYKNNTTKK